MMVVLFSMLFQSLHSYEHVLEQLSHEICHHEPSNNKAEVTHKHHVGNHCFVCEFTLGTFLTSENPVFIIPKPSINFENRFLYSKSIPQYFKGSLFALRAPPVS